MAILTNSGRDKSQSLPSTDEVLDAWCDVQLIMIQWLESIQSKVENGVRWHFGIIAKPEVVDEEGNMVTPAQKTGNRLGIRADRIEARLLDIEKKLNLKAE